MILTLTGEFMQGTTLHFPSTSSLMDTPLYQLAKSSILVTSPSDVYAWSFHNAKNPKNYALIFPPFHFDVKYYLGIYFWLPYNPFIVLTVMFDV